VWQTPVFARSQKQFYLRADEQFFHLAQRQFRETQTWFLGSKAAFFKEYVSEPARFLKYLANEW